MEKVKEGLVVWITGLSGSGKTTLARSASAELISKGISAIVLDGDEMRRGLCSDLGFSVKDRAENVRRVAETANLLKNAGFVVFVALISPMREGRQNAKTIIGPDRFIEVWCRCPLSICEKRDPKNLYRRARLGEIIDFTGISSNYQDPINPALTIDTGSLSADESLGKLYRFLITSNYLIEP